MSKPTVKLPPNLFLERTDHAKVGEFLRDRIYDLESPSGNTLTGSKLMFCNFKKEHAIAGTCTEGGRVWESNLTLSKIKDFGWSITIILEAWFIPTLYRMSSIMHCFFYLI